MNPLRTRDPRTLAALYVGVTIPFIYYGIQVVGASFEPNYSFFGQAASELGSDRAAKPAVFNVGIMVQGVVTLVASLGFLRAYLRIGVHPVLAVLAWATLAVNGVQTLWAGYFPMPDPRHGGHPAFIIAMILLPVFQAAVLWKRSDRALRVYFVATLLLLVAMVPIMSGVSGIDTVPIRGLLQRIYTLTVFPVIGVAAWVLARRFRLS